jgi:ABC-type sugar transport system permease subunit
MAVIMRVLLLAGQPGVDAVDAGRTPSARRPNGSARELQAAVRDRLYIASFETRRFSRCWSLIRLTISLLLAVLPIAYRMCAAAMVYKTLLIWPYAVAPAVAGVLWSSCSRRRWAWWPTRSPSVGIDWNHLLEATTRWRCIVMAAVWKQISYNFLFLPGGLQSIPKSLIEAAAIDGAGPGGASGRISSRCCRRPPSSCW